MIESLEREWGLALHRIDALLASANPEALMELLARLNVVGHDDFATQTGAVLRPRVKRALRQLGVEVPFISYVPPNPATIPTGEQHP